jgi:hypothetical protein
MALTKAKLLEIINSGALDGAIFLRQHKVGDLVFSTVNTNPGAIYGGTWIAWGSGRVPVGADAAQTEFNTVEKTGGSKLLQSHSHYLFSSAGTNINVPAWTAKDNGTIGGSDTLGNVSFTMSAGTGNGQNLQPYITCYMWKRTA